MSKCGECSLWINGGDWGLCCKIDPGLHYEDSDACEKFKPLECAICDETGGVVLDKYRQTIYWNEKQMEIERCSYRCTKCGRAYESGWMFDRNVARIAWARRMLGEVKE